MGIACMIMGSGKHGSVSLPYVCKRVMYSMPYMYAFVGLDEPTMCMYDTWSYAIPVNRCNQYPNHILCSSLKACPHSRQSIPFLMHNDSAMNMAHISTYLAACMPIVLAVIWQSRLSSQVHVYYCQIDKLTGVLSQHASICYKE